MHGLVRRARVGDVAACREIVTGLPAHFTDDVPAHVAEDLERHGGWAVDVDGVPCGFAIVARRGHAAAEVLWAAVRDDCRGCGLGSRLATVVLDELGADGVALVEVKTLDASAGYAPYEATRAFWARHGFVHVDTIDPLPGWSAGSPAAIYVLALASTATPR